MLNDVAVDNEPVDNVVDGLLQLTNNTKYNYVRYEIDKSCIKDEKESTSILSTTGTKTEFKLEMSVVYPQWGDKDNARGEGALGLRQ
eukprot:11381001-Ditylum_brightwellii.AAC.1